MFDQVYGRELPPMHEWSQALLDEAIKCQVQFGVLVLGQGMVTGQLVRVTPGAKIAVVRVTADPRDSMVGVDYPAEMRYISEIRHPANDFSLMKPANSRMHKAATMKAARRLLARAKTHGAGEGVAQGAVRSKGNRVVRVSREPARRA